MPISRKRKKKGKKVGSGTQIKIDPNKESSITLQDLINVLAYQEANPEEAAGNKPKIETVPGENWDEDDSNEQENQDGR